MGILEGGGYPRGGRYPTYLMMYVIYLPHLQKDLTDKPVKTLPAGGKNGSLEYRGTTE